MTVRRLKPVSVPKPWGRTDLPPEFSAGSEEKIGEVWFTDPATGHVPLLVKYLFTSEKLSVQVHPGDEDARRSGLCGGKSECWYVLDAAPGATLGIGLRHPVGEAQLREAALNGTLEPLIDWKPVKAGSFFHIPAGTIHAIGGGIRLVEIQQNNDVTYRLFDYGRPRALHLDEGLAVAEPEPYTLPDRIVTGEARERLVDGDSAPFVLDSLVAGRGEILQVEGRPLWFVPLRGHGTLDSQNWSPGECWLIDERAEIVVKDHMHAFIARAAEPRVA